MRPDEAEKIIIENVAVTSQKVRLMKSALVRSRGDLHGALKEIGIELPRQVVINPAVDSANSLKAASDFISFALAGCEALWALVHAGVFVMASGTVTEFDQSVSWTTIYGHGGGQSAGWQFPQFRSSYPA